VYFFLVLQFKPLNILLLLLLLLLLIVIVSWLNCLKA
jgi:hypothetical protein